MSGRREQYGTSIPNPAVRHYTWGSNEKAFRYYDKEAGENKTVFPLKVAFITSRSTVRGWHDETDSSIYANEVKNTTKEPLRVYSSKPNKSGNTLIGLGLYQEIKPKLGGGHFEKVIYAFEEGVGIVKIYLKGASLMVFSNFEKESKGLMDNMITIESFTNEKKGSNKYTVPVFKLGEKLEKGSKFDVMVDEAFDSVDEYFKLKDASTNNKEDEGNADQGYADQGYHASMSSAPVAETEDDLPF